MRVLASYLLILIAMNTLAQSNDEDDIMDVINAVFIAMRTNDSTLLTSCFVDSPKTYTIYTGKEGETKLVEGNFRRFVEAVGKPKDQVWNEPIWNAKIAIDGDLASVWVDYAFYLDDQFSHCGVDAFHLVHLNQRWRIFHLADTRKKEGCEIPDEVKP